MKHWLFFSICLLVFAGCTKQNSQSEMNSDTCAVSMDVVSTQLKHVEAVDLGLSVLWADRNLGASEPADCGEYYPTLKAQDTIKALLGDGWRLPTVKEMEELFHQTDGWDGAYIDAKGIRVQGREWRSKINGKTIFMPTAGTMNGKLIMDFGTYAAYVTSTHTFEGQYSKGMWGGYWDEKQAVGVIPWHEITSLNDSPECKYTIRPVKDK